MRNVLAVEKHLMVKNGKGGGNTKMGLVFEGETDLSVFLNSQEGYKVEDGKMFYNIECKYQQVNGSIDEKLQTCDFK